MVFISYFRIQFRWLQYVPLHEATDSVTMIGLSRLKVEMYN